MRSAFALLIASLQIGCMKMTIVRDQTNPMVERKTHPRHSFLEGFLTIPGTLQSEALCPKGQIQALDLSLEGKDVLITTVTGGLYVPNQIEVSCSGTGPNKN